MVLLETIVFSWSWDLIFGAGECLLPRCVPGKELAEANE